MTIPTSNTQLRTLTRAEKVAAVLLSLDKEIAQRLLKHFDQVEIRRIAKLAAGLGSIPATDIETIFEEFGDHLANNGVDLIGTAGQAEELLSGAIPPEQVSEIMSEVLGASNQQFWSRLSSMSEATIAAYLVNEHPQTIAIVASKLESALAAKMLAQFPAQTRNEVVRRMLTAGPVSNVALRLIETTLQEELMGATSPGVSKGANTRVAAIINQMDGAQAEGILQAIAGTEPTIADELKKMLFTFEDIPKLSRRARMVLFDQIPTDRLILALRGADAVVREAILPCLSARMRRMVEAEIATPNVAPRRDVVRAQRQIADAVLRLVEQGTIEIGGAEE